MRNLFTTAFFTFVLASLVLIPPPGEFNQVVITPLSPPEQIVTKALPKMKPILSEHQQIAKTARVVSRMYRTISVPEARQVVGLAFKHAKRNNIDPYLIIGLIAAESSFRQNVVSHMGAGGFMQVMEIYHADKLKGRSVFDPHVNIQTGVKILSNCLKKHRTNKRALGCYNGVRSAKGIQAYYDKVSKKRERIKRLVM